MYRSVEDVPPSLRMKLQETTRGLNAGTILIADKRGQQELIRAFQAQPIEVQRRMAETVLARAVEEAPKQIKRFAAGGLRTWLELLLPVVIGASLWFFIESRF